MIDELVARNLGVIQTARIEPAPGLTVITGETGAGKTLLLGALRLLLGGEARPELVGPFGDEAVAEGRFIRADGEEIGAARRLPRDGRSRAYLDGSIASARSLEEHVAGLVEVVAQHDQLSLGRPAEARSLVDRRLDDEGRRFLTDYQEAWNQLDEAIQARDQVGGDRAALARELDLVTFQAEEIARSGFTPGDDEELGRLGERLRHAEEIASHLAEALRRMDTGREAVGEAVSAVRRAARLDPGLDDLSATLSGAADGLDVLSRDLRTAGENVELDPHRLEEVERRLTELGELRRKYGRTLDEILRFGEEAARRRSELDRLLQRADVVDQDVEEARRTLGQAGERLSAARRQAGEKLVAAAVEHLRELGFSQPSLEVDVAEAAPGPGGADTVRLLFASDSRLASGPVGSVASGGELSRLILALRLAGGTGEARTLVFDEIDAGIGGATALTLGRKLARLAEDRQVLCVTHLPQLAAFADRHYVVRREATSAGVVGVEGNERVAELARMLAGLPESERGREAAEELLELAAAG